MSEWVKKSRNLSTHKKCYLSTKRNLSHKKIMQPQKKSCNLSTKKSSNLVSQWVRKITQPLHTKTSRNLSSHKNLCNLSTQKNHAASPHKKLRNLQKNYATSPQDNHITSTHKKITQHLHKKIARIAKRCPENITSFVKCVKLLFPKVLRKWEKKNKDHQRIMVDPMFMIV